MNTAQTYTGKNTPAKTPVDYHYQNLHRDIDNFAQERGAGADVEGMADLLMGYIAKAVGYNDEPASSNKRYELRAHHIDRIYTTLRLMVSVTQIKEGWASIERFEQHPVAPVAPVATAPPSSANVNSIDPIEPWRVKFLTEVLTDSSGSETLFSLLHHAWSMRTRTDPTAAITKLLHSFTGNPANDLNDEENRQLIRDVTRHIADVNELNLCFSCFDTTTGYMNIATDHEQ